MSKTIFHSLIASLLLVVAQLLPPAHTTPEMASPSEIGDITPAQKKLTSQRTRVTPLTAQEKILLDAVNEPDPQYPNNFIRDLIKLHNYYSKVGQEKRIYLVISYLTEPRDLKGACGRITANLWRHEMRVAEELNDYKCPQLALAYCNRVIEFHGGSSRYLYRRALLLKISLLKRAGDIKEISATQELFNAINEDLRYNNENRYALLDFTGNLITNLPFDQIDVHDAKPNEFLAGRINKRYQFFDRNGKLAFNQDFDGAQSFSEGLAGVKVGGKWGFIDRSGKVVIPFQYDTVFPFKEGFACVGIGKPYLTKNTFGFIDLAGEMVIKPTYGDSAIFADGIACVRPNSGKAEYIDKAGKVLFSSSTGGNFHEGLAKTNEGFIDTAGNLVIPKNVYLADPYSEYHTSKFSDGLAPIIKDKKAGYIDRTGKIVIEPQFALGFEFSEGLASVCTADRKWHYINTLGRNAFNKSFDYAGHFKNGLGYIKNGNRSGFINKNGQVLFMLDPKYGVYQHGMFGDRILVYYSAKVLNPDFDKNYR